MEKPGFYRGRHYSDYTDNIRMLVGEGKFDVLERLLLRLVSTAEQENIATRSGVAAWPYDLLGALYHDEHAYVKEAAIYERFSRQSHTPDRFLFVNRLARARGMLLA
ncbi:hypothetical protein F8S13_06340 [Chloroflexia bacterium SDU3-3]|nr:hypothetical protein F8S13_06340 [Chloroflexia bacterium SDU3-3]